METNLTAEEWLGDRTKLIAEFGTNHNGSPQLAHEMLTMCLRLGVDSCKGQMRDIEQDPAWRERPYAGHASFGETYYLHRKALELPIEQHLNIRNAARCATLGAWGEGLTGDYSISVWDVKSAKTAAAVGGWQWIKVPSASLTNDALLEVVAGMGCVVVLSTGMSEPEEIAHAIGLLDEAGALERLVLLCCTSTYPSPNDEVHLRRMETMRERWPEIPIGVSGHWAGIQIDSAAVALGARLIERHITLDRTMRGPDHAISVGPRGVELWVRDVRVIEQALGSPEIGMVESEKPFREAVLKKLRMAG